MDKGKDILVAENTIYFYEKPTKLSQASHLFLNVHFYCNFKDEDGKEFHSCTDYYHTNKLLILGDQKAAEEIHKVQSGEEAFYLARKLQAPYEKTSKWKEWEGKKNEMMAKGIKLKFEQNPKLMQDLLLTGSMTLVEDHPEDAYWYILR